MTPISRTQYVLFRFTLGVYLFTHFVMLIPYADQLLSRSAMIGNASQLPTYHFFPNILFYFDQSWFTTFMLCVLAVLSLSFSIGKKLKITSFLLWYGWACLLTANIFTRYPGMVVVGWLLLAIPFIPPGHSRFHKGKPWSVPTPIYVFGWTILALGYAIMATDSVKHYQSQWQWQTLGLLVVHFFTFDRRWVPPKRAHPFLIVRFDGVCNLCNGFVSLLLEEDIHGSLRFAPLQQTNSADSPRTIIVEERIEQSSILFTESEAIIRIMTALGGMWRIASVFKILPKTLRNGLYRFVAKNRYTLFGKSDTCRLPTAEEKVKFLAE